MIFSLGDVLIKIDCRATADTKYTRHHVMLVLGTSVSGNPLVMHMMGEPHNKLIQEELGRGKDLKLIKYSWSNETRDVIWLAAMISKNSNNFILTDEIIQKQRLAVSAFRPDCHLESAKKLIALEAAFHKADKNSLFTPAPYRLTEISCHEWVLSILHYACKHTKQAIPRALRIPPSLAWADRLNQLALNDDRVSCIVIPQLPIIQAQKTSEYKEISSSIKKNTEKSISMFSFFSNWITPFCIKDNAAPEPFIKNK